MSDFHFFPRLPAELRIMVWNASVQPRVVEVNMVHNTRAAARQSRISWRVTPPPEQLATCSEAREVVLPFYQKLICACPDIAIPQEVANNIPSPRPIVYFHPQMDVLSQDFEVLVCGPDPDRIRRPGIKARLGRLTGGFDDIFPLGQPGTGYFSISNLHHLQLNIHILKRSARNPASNGLQDTMSFIDKLLRRPHHTALRTITLRVTQEVVQPTAAAAAQNRNPKPMVYRILPRPQNPAAEPDAYYTTILSNMQHLETQGHRPPQPALLPRLLADEAILTCPRPRNNNTPPHLNHYMVLRVIDPRSPDSEYDDDFGTRWPGTLREGLWWGWLRDGANFSASDYTWLRDLFRWPGSPNTISLWGICGKGYGMGMARV